VNHTRFPVRGSPTRLGVSGQQSYKGWSCRTCMSVYRTPNISGVISNYF